MGVTLGSEVQFAVVGMCAAMRVHVRDGVVGRGGIGEGRGEGSLDSRSLSCSSRLEHTTNVTITHRAQVTRSSLRHEGAVGSRCSAPCGRTELWSGMWMGMREWGSTAANLSIPLPLIHTIRSQPTQRRPMWTMSSWCPASKRLDGTLKSRVLGKRRPGYSPSPSSRRGRHPSYLLSLCFLFPPFQGLSSLGDPVVHCVIRSHSRMHHSSTSLLPPAPARPGSLSSHHFIQLHPFAHLLIHQSLHWPT